MSGAAEAARTGRVLSASEETAILVDPKKRWDTQAGLITGRHGAEIDRSNCTWPAGQAPGTDVPVNDRASRSLSQMLRHDGPVDNEGWADLNSTAIKAGLSMAELATIVRQDAKRRFQICNKNGVPFVRATQGHTIRGVDTSGGIALSEQDAFRIPVVHRTTPDAVAAIMGTGLRSMRRNDVHFYDPRKRSDLATSRGVHIQLDAKRYIRDGGVIRIAPNGVMLVAGSIPAKYLTIVKHIEC
jgi:RNA:NAD 2'-phosphotransferase (TPT1/KptA family)